LGGWTLFQICSMPKAVPWKPDRVQQGTIEKDGQSFVRLLIPDRGRQCAPCLREHNLCCGGRKSVHLRPVGKGELKLPAVPWLRSRVSHEEWADFIAALDAANLEGTVNFKYCSLFPCTVPLLPVQPLCCCLPYQYELGQQVKRDNALNLAVAKFNRYLFMPRGIVVRRQLEFDKESTRYNFLRFDFVPNNGPLDPRELPPGLHPGTQKTDIEDVPLDELLAEIVPCPQLELFGRSVCATPLLIPDVAYYFDGNEPEVTDNALATKYGQRNYELAHMDPEGMMRV
jgi:hypothetical protein